MTRRPPETIILEAINDGLSGNSMWTFKRHGAEKIVAALNVEGYLILHADVFVGMNMIVSGIEGSGHGLSVVLRGLIDGVDNKRTRGK